MHEKLEKDNYELKAGMAVVFSFGSYSDYGFGQIYIVLKDFNYIEEAKKYFMECAEEEWKKDSRDFYLGSYDIERGFETYLIRMGLLALCQQEEIYMGDDFFDFYKWKSEFVKLKEDEKINKTKKKTDKKEKEYQWYDVDKLSLNNKKIIIDNGLIEMELGVPLKDRNSPEKWKEVVDKLNIKRWRYDRKG